MNSFSLAARLLNMKVTIRERSLVAWVASQVLAEKTGSYCYRQYNPFVEYKQNRLSGKSFLGFTRAYPCASIQKVWMAKVCFSLPGRVSKKAISITGSRWKQGCQKTGKRVCTMWSLFSTLIKVAEYCCCRKVCDATSGDKRKKLRTKLTWLVI